MKRISKWILIAGYGLIMLLIGVMIGQSGSTEQADLGESPTVAALTENTNAPADPTVAGEIKFETGKVARVIDGDTIELEGGERVRYIGIDTPETVDPRKPVQCFGVEASKKNKELVEGKTVRLVKDVTDKDRYGRLLRYVYLDDAFINVELVKQGFAYSYSYPPDVKYQDQILKAQQEAEQSKAGLWNACPPKDAPANTASSPAAPAPIPSDGSCAIKGNISSSGEKIYHVPGCGSYNKTVIDTSRGEKMFCSETEAQTAGWRKALNCQ